MAGIAMASAGVIAVNPVVATPAMPDVRATAVGLSAFTNPLVTLQQTLTNTFTIGSELGTNVIGSATKVLQALGNPAMQAELTNFVRTTVTNPLLLLTELAQFPSEYGGRIGAALADMSAAQMEAFAALPGVLQSSGSFLSQGRFLEAFGEINTWFLVSVLADSRQSLLDALKIPGDFAESIGAAPLARVFDAVLDRGVVGNLGRALLGPLVTSIIQTTEILDATRAAVVAGDLVTAVSHLVNAPIKIANAFINGYVPDFTVDPQWPPQVFPGLLSPRGTFDFFFVQLPNAIATALAPPAPVAPVAPAVVTTAVADATLVSASPSDIPGSASLPLTLETPAAAVETASAVEEGKAPEGSTETAVTSPETEDESEGDGSGTSPVDETDGGADETDGGTDDNTDDETGATDGSDSDGAQSGADGDTKPSDTKPSDNKPSDTKPSDTKPSDTKPSDTKSDDSKSNDTKSNDSKPSGSKSNDSKSSDSKSGGGDE